MKLFRATGAEYSSLEAEINQFLATLDAVNVLDVKINEVPPSRTGNFSHLYATVTYKE